MNALQHVFDCEHTEYLVKQNSIQNSNDHEIKIMTKLLALDESFPDATDENISAYYEKNLNKLLAVARLKGIPWLSITSTSIECSCNYSDELDRVLNLITGRRLDKKWLAHNSIHHASRLSWSIRRNRRIVLAIFNHGTLSRFIDPSHFGQTISTAPNR